MKAIEVKHISAAVLLAAILAAVLIIALTPGCSRKEQAGPPPTPEVGVKTVEPQEVTLTTQLPGRTCPYGIAEIRPQVSGIVLKRLFTEGAFVHEGDLLYQIDPAPFEATLDSAKANLDSATKAADRARAGISASEAVIVQRKATLHLAQTDHVRYENAFRENAVAASERDRSENAVEVSDAGVRVAEAQLESDKQALAGAEAAIKQTEAAIRTATINLGYTKITSPISGKIGRSSITEGAMVTAYQPVPMATVQQLDPIYVDIAQSSADLHRLERRVQDGRLAQDHDGQNKVNIALEDGTPYSLDGALAFRDITVDPTTGSFILRSVFPNPKGVLLPHMFVEATIREGVNHKALLVPQQSVFRDPRGNPQVLVVDKENKTVLRNLTVDRAIRDQWLVTTGVEAGERIVFDGMQRVRPGMNVRPVDVAPRQAPTTAPALAQADKH